MMHLKFFRSSAGEDNRPHLSEPLSANDPSPLRPTFTHANTEPRRWKKPHQHFSLTATKSATASSVNTRNHHYRLSSVIQLFEEKAGDHPSFKVKANGAIVLNQTHHSNRKSRRDSIDFYDPPPVEDSVHNGFLVDSTRIKGTSYREYATASSSDDDGYEDEDEDTSISSDGFTPTITPLCPPPRPAHANKSDMYFDACEALTSCSKELVDQILHENQRLRDQLALERQEYRTKLLKSNESLTIAKREARYIHRILSYTRILNDEDIGKRRRRQSICGATVAVRRELGIDSLSSFCHTSTMSHEHKIKILLDEIDAMHLEDDQLQGKLGQLEQRNAILNQALLDKDETIRQLKFDRHVESLKR